MTVNSKQLEFKPSRVPGACVWRRLEHSATGCAAKSAAAAAAAAFKVLIADPTAAASNRSSSSSSSIFPGVHSTVTGERAEFGGARALGRATGRGSAFSVL